MNTYKGTTGLKYSWQAEFPETTPCKKCKGEARIMFVAHEDYPDDKDNFISFLRKNGGKGDYWLHDACAVAVYLCKDCFEPMAILNQG